MDRNGYVYSHLKAKDGADPVRKHNDAVRSDGRTGRKFCSVKVTFLELNLGAI